MCCWFVFLFQTFHTKFNWTDVDVLIKQTYTLIILLDYYQDCNNVSINIHLLPNLSNCRCYVFFLNLIVNEFKMIRAPIYIRNDRTNVAVYSIEMYRMDEEARTISTYSYATLSEQIRIQIRDANIKYNLIISTNFCRFFLWMKIRIWNMRCCTLFWTCILFFCW